MAYIIDMAGSQFGQHEALLSLEEYMRDVANEVGRIHPHGDARTHRIAICKGEKNHEFNSTYDFRAYHLNSEIHKVFLKATEVWEATNRMAVQSIVFRDEAGYLNGCDSFIDTVSEHIIAYLAEWRKNGSRVIPHPGDPPAVAARKYHPRIPLCTVTPIGPGSRAYQRWVQDSAEDEKMFAYMDEVDARAGNVYYC